MIVYFNNCRGKDHVELYGKDAFFDLWTTDVRATNLDIGQTCIVATRAKDDEITFSWFSFSREEIKRYQGRPCRVFYGALLKSDTHSKADGTSVEPYQIFFDKNATSKDRLS